MTDRILPGPKVEAAKFDESDFDGMSAFQILVFFPVMTILMCRLFGMA